MLKSIFELFTQLPRSLVRSDGGLGVGLTLATAAAGLAPAPTVALARALGADAHKQESVPTGDAREEAASLAS